MVGVNTLIPNKLVKKSIIDGEVPELSGYQDIRAEVKYGQNSRIDILLENGKDRWFVEIKNVTYVEDHIACFPDAVTTRGLKHLHELQEEVAKGNRSVMFYLIQRMDAKLFRPAGHIDPEYAKELLKAVHNGVEILVYDVTLDPEGIRLNHALPYEM